MLPLLVRCSLGGGYATNRCRRRQYFDRIQGVPKNMSHFKILTKTHFRVLLYFYALMYESAYENLY